MRKPSARPEPVVRVGDYPQLRTISGNSETTPRSANRKRCASMNATGDSSDRWTNEKRRSSSTSPTPTALGRLLCFEAPTDFAVLCDSCAGRSAPDNAVVFGNQGQCDGRIGGGSRSNTSSARCCCSPTVGASTVTCGCSPASPPIVIQKPTLSQ